MANNVLVVVDMQNDFIDGALGTKEAQQIVPDVVKYINEWEGNVIATYDTHYDNYEHTLEGKMLPIRHCIHNTDGWYLNKDVLEAIQKKDISTVSLFTKNTFGSIQLAMNLSQNDVDSITLIGLCTDICVISNALILRAKFPDTIINVVANCCAGVTPEKHKAALEVMRSCQINVI